MYRVVKNQKQFLQSDTEKELVEIPLPDDQFRFIEAFESINSAFKEQIAEEFGTWGTEMYIIYFDLGAGDKKVIQKGDYVYFNRSQFMARRPYEPRDLEDTVRLEIKDIPRHAGLEVGMLEVIGIAI